GPRATAPLAVRLGLHQDDPDRVVRPRLGLVRGPQLDHDVAEHARPSRRPGHRPFLDDRIEVAVVADAADVAAAGRDDVVPQGEFGVPAVQHVAAIRLQRPPQDVLLVGLAAVERRGDLDADGQLAVDLEVGMEPPTAVRLPVLVAEVGGLGQRGQGLDHAAIDGGEHPADVLRAGAAGGWDLGPELGDDRLEPLGLEDLDGFGQGPQGGPRATDLAADLLQPAGLLQGAEGAEDGVEEEQEDQGAVVVEMELAIAGLVAPAADIMEAVEEREYLVEVLEAPE